MNPSCCVEQRLAIEQAVLVLLRHSPPAQASVDWFCSLSPRIWPNSFMLVTTCSNYIQMLIDTILVNMSRFFPPLNVSHFHLKLMIHKYLRRDTSVPSIGVLHGAGGLDFHLAVVEPCFQSGLHLFFICHCVYLFVSLL